MKTIINMDSYIKAGFTYEEIQGIIEAKNNVINGEILSEEEMDNFIDNELFANYMVNA